MTARDKMAADPLQRIVARLPQPQVPHGLARRIVARAVTEGQQAPREQVIMAAPQPVRNHPWRWMALSGACAAAVVAMLMSLSAPARRVAVASPVVARPPARDEAAPQPMRVHMTSAAIARPNRPVPTNATASAIDEALPATSVIAQADAPEPVEDAPVAPAGNAPSATPAIQLAKAGPAAPVQGPGIHDGLAPLVSEGVGLGLSGGGAVPTISGTGAARSPGYMPGAARR